MNEKILKLYRQECGYRGSIIAIAFSEEEARAIMKKEWGHINYSDDIPVESCNIQAGLCFGDHGDA